jgi:hypothetical protein
MSSTPTAEAPWQSGLRGARANLAPGLVLQACALALVLGYYHDAAVASALARLTALHLRAGYAFAVVSTGLAAGVLPFLYLHFGQRDARGRPRYGWLQGLGLTAFWAYKGFEVDLWYRIQAHVVGPGHAPATIALKVFFDQFVYCPAFAIPVTAAVYQLVDSGYDWAGLRADVGAPRWYRRRVLPILISNLGVWVPAVAIIYALPTPLQLPLENVVLCFYTLIVAHQTRTEPRPEALAPRAGTPSRAPAAPG